MTTTQQVITQIEERIAAVILGKQQQIRLLLACLLAKGHVLLEDAPGVGKTTLAHVVAKVLGMQFQRVQFTSDLLPADIIGVSIYDTEAGQFKFHQGAIFTEMLLADEINRATPKTQSALLEAMAEQQVTVDGKTRGLSPYFFVIATQNPQYQIGTFPLPESQLDRFTMRLHLGYPDATSERLLLKGESRRDLIENIEPVIELSQLLELQQQVQQVQCRDALIDYVQNLLAYSRQSDTYIQGLSPRAGLALLSCAKSWALLQARDHVLPEDVQAVLSAVVNHRLQTHDIEHQDIGSQLLTAVDIP